MRTPVKVGLITLLVASMLGACGQGDDSAGPASPPAAGPTADADEALNIVGLVDGTTLVNFSTDDTSIRDNRDVTGLEGDTSLVGIDHRVQDGLLYGVGDEGGVYTIDDAGLATKVKQLTVALDGASFGVDFNPAANALRVVSDTGQNLRQPFADPNAPTATDGALTNPAMAPATGTVAATGVTGAAYTNNDTEAATATTLFVIDTAADRVSLQSPANAGSLAAAGNLGVDAGPDAGFDIYSTVTNGVTSAMTAFATLQVDNAYGLYRIDLLTGKAENVGDLAGNVSDIAVPLSQS
ncbi:MAG: DUF4394 domain-containing protein [Pseudonocardia sp.]